MRSFLLTVFIGILAFSQSFLAARPASLPVKKHKVVIIGHHGSLLKVPEINELK